jgi:hypothetical protein
MRPRISMTYLMITILVSFVGNAARTQSPAATRSASNSPASAENCLSRDELTVALRDLSLGRTFNVQQEALAFLRANANKSTTCRNQVVTGLLAEMDQPNIDLTGGQPQFYLWHYGTKLLGELKAVEALDLLIANLDRDDGTPFPFDHHPALVTVIDMGEISLPKLQQVLKETSDPATKRYAVFCIALIGGDNAQKILKEALGSESDPCLVSCIRATLNAFVNKRRPNQITAESRTEWYTTFMCNGQ